MSLPSAPRAASKKRSSRPLPAGTPHRHRGSPVQKATCPQRRGESLTVACFYRVSCHLLPGWELNQPREKLNRRRTVLRRTLQTAD